MCKPKPKQRPAGDIATKQKDITNNTGQGYSSASKRDSDYEHAGVAIAVHRRWVSLVEEVRETSGRNMTVILKSGSGKLALTASHVRADSGQ